MAIKESLGKLKVPAGLVDLIWATGFSELPLSAEHAEHHQDPFDRMLVAQAQSDRLALVTADGRCLRYDVKTLDVAR